MPVYDLAILGAGWALWVAPFFLLKRSHPSSAPATVDRRARWGIGLQMLAFSAVWFAPFSMGAPAAWRVAFAVVFFAAGDVLTWTATRALGKQWRIDAGLSDDHELVRSGPYRIVRHPIYAAMWCSLLGTGLLLTPLARLALAVPIFALGIEIRVRIEDALLVSRFGEKAREYQRSVPAYLPLVR